MSPSLSAKRLQQLLPFVGAFTSRIIHQLLTTGARLLHAAAAKGCKNSRTAAGMPAASWQLIQGKVLNDISLLYVQFEQTVGLCLPVSSTCKKLGCSTFCTSSKHPVLAMACTPATQAAAAAAATATAWHTAASQVCVSPPHAPAASAAAAAAAACTSPQAPASSWSPSAPTNRCATPKAS
jgi:hypothetical protein